MRTYHLRPGAHLDAVDLSPGRQVVTMHHNVFGGFTSLKIGLFSAGTGRVAFSDFRYRSEAPEPIPEGGVLSTPKA